MHGTAEQVCDIIHPCGDPGVLLICDHASNHVPEGLNDLGLDAALLARHIGWDIGAGALTRRLSDLLDAPAVLCRFSRLVIDPNRPIGHPQSIPPVSDEIVVPGNQNLDADAAACRADRFHRPYHDQIAQRIDAACAHGVPALVAVHSFTPIMDGYERPWHAAILHDDDTRLATPILEAFKRYSGLVVGDNEPYTGYSDLTYTLPHHATGRGLPSVALEIRQDLIDTPASVEQWAYRLKDVLKGPLADAAHRTVVERS